MALYVGVNKATACRALRYPTVHQVTFSQLFRMLARAEPRFRILISTKAP